MKLIMFVLITSAILVNCINRSQTKSGNEFIVKPIIKFWDTSTNRLKLSTDQKIINAWESFKEALLKRDIEQLKSLSTECIACANCDTNNYISVKVFYEKYWDRRLDSVFINRMNDTTKVKGHYDNANWHIYSQNCISQSSGLSKPRIAEIFVKISDPNSLYKGFEGGDAAIAFIETASGYKFCGYSTIP